MGRYSTLVIPLYIPPSPKWAHDVVLKAATAWNNAELWQNQNNNSASVYTFVETDDGTATSTISFSMPEAYAGIAVGWTNYNFAPGSRTSILGTQTFLDPTIFNQSPRGNVTAWRYAFRLALHELGRIQGLGSVLDGQDIMDPMGTPQRASDAPNLSTLDLFALHILASGSAPQFVTLPAGKQNQLTVATHFLPNQAAAGQSPITSSSAKVMLGSQPHNKQTPTMPRVMLEFWTLGLNENSNALSISHTHTNRSSCQVT
jgi:hypothetical protein